MPVSAAMRAGSRRASVTSAANTRRTAGSRLSRRPSRSSPFGLNSAKRCPLPGPCKLCGMRECTPGASASRQVPLIELACITIRDNARRACRSCRLRHQYRIAARNSSRRSSAVAGRGESLVTRCCGSVPATRASTSSAPNPTAESPFGMPTRRMIRSIWLARISPASSAAAPPVSAPSSRAACR